MDDNAIKLAGVVGGIIISVIGTCFAGARLSRCTLIKCGACEVHRDVNNNNDKV